MNSRVHVAFQQFDRAELRFCRYLNRSTSRVPLRALWRAVSWLGDGWFWYLVIALLPVLYGSHGWRALVQMTVTGIAGVLIYKLVKRRAVRERPFITHRTIECAAVPLDRYSFPSGHVLHAVCFTLLMSTLFPEWVPLLIGFTMLVALSRVALGLHYPTDVAAGAVLGAALAGISVWTGRLI